MYGELVQLERALVVSDACAFYGNSSAPKACSAINEPKLLDESLDDQLGLVFKYLNSLTLAVNQHASLINVNNSRLGDIPSLDEIKEGLGALGKEKEEQGHLPPYLQPLQLKVNTIEGQVKEAHKKVEANKDHFNSLHERTDNKFNIYATSDECRKNIREGDLKVLTQLREEFETSFTQISDQMKKSLEKERETQERVNTVQKETVWKIDDCLQLIKLRPTEQVFRSMIQEIEQKLSDGNYSLAKRPLSSKDSGDSYTQLLQNPTREDLTTLLDKVTILENRCEKLTAISDPSEGSTPGSLASLKEKLDNNSLKFDDFQIMIHQNQQRLEHLYEELKKIDVTVSQFTMIDQTVNSKIEMLLTSFEMIKEQLSGHEEGLEKMKSDLDFAKSNQYNASYRQREVAKTVYVKEEGGKSSKEGSLEPQDSQTKSVSRPIIKSHYSSQLSSSKLKDEDNKVPKGFFKEEVIDLPKISNKKSVQIGDDSPLSGQKQISPLDLKKNIEATKSQPRMIIENDAVSTPIKPSEQNFEVSFAPLAESPRQKRNDSSKVEPP